MVGCERCGARFSAIRMATIEHCPRCLLRDDIAAPLTAIRLQRVALKEPQGNVVAGSDLPIPSSPGTEAAV